MQNLIIDIDVTNWRQLKWKDKCYKGYDLFSKTIKMDIQKKEYKGEFIPGLGNNKTVIKFYSS